MLSNRVVIITKMLWLWVLLNLSVVVIQLLPIGFKNIYDKIIVKTSLSFFWKKKSN